MGFEQWKEQASSKPENLADLAMDSIKNIQSLASNIDINKAFPRMKELMEIPGADKTFKDISDASKVCKWQNGAVDRKKMSNLCRAIDPEARS